MLVVIVSDPVVLEITANVKVRFPSFEVSATDDPSEICIEKSDPNAIHGPLASRAVIVHRIDPLDTRNGQIDWQVSEDDVLGFPSTG